MSEYYFQRERAPPSWLESERNQNSKIRLQRPWEKTRSPSASLRCSEFSSVPAWVTARWLPGVEALWAPLLSSHLLIPFYFLFPSVVRALPFHSMKSTPRNSLLHLGQAGRGHFWGWFAVVLCGFKGTFPLRRLNHIFSLLWKSQGKAGG